MRSALPLLVVSACLLSGCGLRAYALPDASAERSAGIGQVDLLLRSDDDTGAIAAVGVAMHDQGDRYRDVTVSNIDQQISFTELPEGLHDLTISAFDAHGRLIGRFVHQVAVDAGRDLVFPVACVAVPSLGNSQPLSIQFSPLESSAAAAPLSASGATASALTRRGGAVVLGPSADIQR